MTPRIRSRFTYPAFSWSLGIAVAVAFLLGGRPVDAAIVAALFFAIGTGLLVGGRSETVRVVRGDLSDERWQMHDLRATALAGLLLISVVIGAWLVEIARGHDGSPYWQLGAIGGLGYLAAIVVLRLRG